MIPQISCTHRYNYDLNNKLKNEVSERTTSKIEWETCKNRYFKHCSDIWGGGSQKTLKNHLSIMYSAINSFKTQSHYYWRQPTKQEVSIKSQRNIKRKKIEERFFEPCKKNRQEFLVLKSVESSQNNEKQCALT